METPVLANQQKTKMLWPCADTGCSLDDRPGEMTDKKGWKE